MTIHSNKESVSKEPRLANRGDSPANPLFEPQSLTSLTPASILHLQRVIGNSATAQLIQRDAPSAATNTAPSTAATAMTRQEFEHDMAHRFGVTQIVDGALQDQINALRRSNTPAVQIPNWQAWNPGSESITYQYILDGIQDFVDRIGGLPPFQRLVFFDQAYQVNYTTGITTPKPNVGAEFGAGEMFVYRLAETGARPLPIGRSSTSSGTAVRDNPTQQQNVSRTITHELGHGLVEVAMSLNQHIVDEYKAAVGWTPGEPTRLYDIGSSAVQTAFANGQTPPSYLHITSDRWNDPWQEQPVSVYMTTHPSEDFPEAVMTYVENPNLLLARSPHRFEFIQSHMDTWRNHLTQFPQVGDFPAPSGDTQPA